MEARINGVTLSYELTGEGKGIPWVLMHGVGMNRHLWDGVAPWLGRHGRVMALDLRGFGQSSKPPKLGMVYTFEDHIADLLGLIQYLGFGRVRLMGLSVGGMIAQRFAHEYPTLVDALVLVDTTSDFTEEARQRRLQRAELIKCEGMYGEIERSIQRWFTATAIERRLPIINSVRDWLRSCDVNGYIANVCMVATWRFTEYLQGIKSSTLIIAGEQDPSMPPAQAQVMLERISGSELVVIPNASHIPPLEQPEDFRRAVEEFLRRLDSRKQDR